MYDDVGEIMFCCWSTGQNSNRLQWCTGVGVFLRTLRTWVLQSGDELEGSPELFHAFSIHGYVDFKYLNKKIFGFRNDFFLYNMECTGSEE